MLRLSLEVFAHKKSIFLLREQLRRRKRNFVFPFACQDASRKQKESIPCSECSGGSERRSGEVINRRFGEQKEGKMSRIQLELKIACLPFNSFRIHIHSSSDSRNPTLHLPSISLSSLSPSERICRPSAHQINIKSTTCSGPFLSSRVCAFEGPLLGTKYVDCYARIFLDNKTFPCSAREIFGCFYAVKSSRGEKDVGREIYWNPSPPE